MSSRQTLSFLIKRFEEAGIRPETRHGQNFLIDLNLLDLLVRSADLGPRDVVLEVGTGLGSLTSRMAQVAAHVVTVEIDPKLYQLASEELSSLSNVTMLLQDALKNKNTLDPAMLATLHEKMGDVGSSQFKLVANLPYNVGTPILSNLLTVDPLPVSLTATIQKELADRMAASPGTKDYSALSVWMQALCDVTIVREMAPQVFWLRPKVHSAIVHIVPSASKRAMIRDVSFFHGFLRALFAHRRKVLRSGLATCYKHELEKPTIDDILSGFALPSDARAEQLDVPALIALSDAVQERIGIASSRLAADADDDNQANGQSV